MSREKGPRLWQRLFQGRPDFLALLDVQMGLTAQSVTAFLQWCDTRSPAVADDIYELERRADSARRAVSEALATAFETPLDREDIDDVSRSIDDIVDGLRYAVREALALKVRPDASIREMVVTLEEGVKALRQSVSCCQKNRVQAQQAAARARHAQRVNERVYTQALAHLLDEEEDIKVIFRQREGYRQMMRLGTALETAAEQIEHALNKLG